MRERAAARGMGVPFDADLGDEPDPAWRGDLDQLVFRGSRFMEEVVFFHRKTRALILADLVENFEPRKIGGAWRWLVRLVGAAHPDGKAPIDLRLTFLGGKDAARASFERMLSWEPARVIVAHGAPTSGTARRNSAARSVGWIPSRSSPRRVVVPGIAFTSA